jgi:DNA mismatch repair protein MutL
MNFGGSIYRERKTENAHWESLYIGLKNDTKEIESFPFEQEAVSSSLFNVTEIEESKNRTYQIQKKYILSSIKSGMMVIDQKRAHQRILYEQYLKNMTVQQASSQHLLFPLEIYFSTNEIHLMKELKAALENTGFIFDVIESDKIIISGIPIQVTESEVSIVLDELVNDLQDGIPESSFSQNDSIAKSMARSLAVKTGTYLTEKEQENIVNGLFACKEPDVSPFNKPTFITISVDDLDKKFTI